jgi:5-methylcytosine-specific restriction endonuclease McrA
VKKCKIQNCGKKHWAFGYCQKHYMKLIYVPNHKEECKISHQKYYMKTRILKTKKCAVVSCKKKIYNKTGLCSFHRNHLLRGLPLDNKKYTPKGKRNVNWKGGIFSYPNHYLMKKRRLIVLLNNPKCEYCGKDATQIHHKDENKANHKFSNLVAVCQPCNAKQSSKFYKKYGLTLKEITNKINNPKRSLSYWKKHKEKINKFLLTKKNKVLI